MDEVTLRAIVESCACERAAIEVANHARRRNDYADAYGEEVLFALRDRIDEAIKAYQKTNDAMR